MPTTPRCQSLTLPVGFDGAPGDVLQVVPYRKAKRAASLLFGSCGYLHADGYSGFAGFYRPDPITGRVQFEGWRAGSMPAANCTTCIWATQSAAAKGCWRTSDV